MEPSAKPCHSLFHFPFLLILHLKRSLLTLLFSLTTSFFALLLLFLLSYNAFTVFFIRVPKSSHKSLLLPPPTHFNLSSSVFLALKEENFPLFNKTHLPLLPNSTHRFSIRRSRRERKHKRGRRSVRSEAQFPLPLFQTRLKAFFSLNSSCKVRFFMTWISPLKAFGERELFSVESLFKVHPEACLVIVSKSLDSDTGTRVLKPFLNNGFRVMAIAPDFNYLFKDTHAEAWFNRLKEGIVNPGEVSLGQNLSNLLRLALLYKFGGMYIDADVLVLKSFSNLRNTIGAQNFDAKTGKWSRLNNAVLIFDKKHPLLFKFIEEFALTFDGNKWGHNGPYLISRVVSRVSGRSGFNFTVLPPSAFYPVDWKGIRSLFRGPRDEFHAKWLVKKMEQIRKESFAVHLWNRQSRKLKVVKGSIVDRIISSCCIFCNT
ncbi:lactosylceramide 4-alpha-galactosyltransferase [Abrus precatorius]|uniref:Lactosylceramide 4-alpha-galactosyltransferase n=1 Tax=Abrus precatorius TaxID=3816 RepID=A0A8B8K464_ABRPR|nr:lactosylceramide 4-alpha-galactosyltransferase [Abrus precatorius]